MIGDRECHDGDCHQCNGPWAHGSDGATGNGNK